MMVIQDALENGAADLIGLGRPMCVDTDAPNQLFNGVSELNRYEKTVRLLPKWAEFLNKSSFVRTISGFSVQYWYYAQLLSIGRTGVANHSLSVFSAIKILTRHEKRWLKERREVLRGSKQEL